MYTTYLMDVNKRSKKTVPILIVLVAIVLVIVGIVMFNKTKADTNTKDQNPSSQVTKIAVPPSGVVYPSGWQEAKEINSTNKQNGVISEATRNNPTALVVVRETIGSLEKDFDIKKQPDLVAASLQKELNGFKLISKSVTKVGSYDSVKINYTAPAPDELQYETAMFIIPTPNKTFYVTYQSPEDEAEISKDIATINQAIVQYIKTHRNE
jgi:hypothetical protein